MIPRPSHRRSGSSLLRTAVVALSTLAILVVCYSMYQFSQMSGAQKAGRTEPRLPSPPTEFAGAATSSSPGASSEGVPVGQARIGAARDINITIYPASGNRAALEINVSDWIPRPGSQREFLLKSPIIRTRTKQGNNVRVTAGEGLLEASRQANGRLDPVRGRLYSGVLVEFDRNKSTPNDPDPAQGSVESDQAADLVRIQTEELEFDLEYRRLLLPGSLKLTASDASFEAAELEVRFDEADNRVESLRIARGGRLELTQHPGRLELPVSPSARRGGALTVADWVRTSLQAKLAPPSAAQAAPRQNAPTAAVGAKGLVGADAGIPVFRAKDEAPREEKRPTRYFARFNGSVDVSQVRQDVVVSRVLADALEILREFAADSHDEAAKPTPGLLDTPSSTPTPPEERIVLEWQDGATVETVPPESTKFAEAMHSRVVAEGSPVRLWTSDGEGEASRIVYSPDSGDAEFVGEDDAPVLLHSLTEGRIRTRKLSLHRAADSFEIHAQGPGSLSGLGSAPGATDRGLRKEPNPPSESAIDFQGEMHAKGRVVQTIGPDLSGRIVSTEERLLNEVSFGGGINARDRDSTLRADSATIFFGSRRSLRRTTQTVNRMVTHGNVVLSRAEERLSCGELTAEFALSTSDASVPTRATAADGVVMVQGERTLQAKNRLLIDFESHETTALSPAAVSETEVAARKVGPHAVADNPTSPRSPGRAAISRFRAFEEVSVFDPKESFEVKADELDCSLADGGNLQTAVIRGRGDLPATVRLDTLTVTGAEVRARIPDQWAEVPGPGRMLLQSYKDLDGRTVPEPVPVAITWTQSMRYQGRENFAIFTGDVHAASESTTTFDCAELRAEFDDVVKTAKDAPARRLGVLQPIVDSVVGDGDEPRGELSRRTSAKQIASIYATGHAVAQTSTFDSATGEMKSRARLEGPKLSVNLRDEVSKMLIEGAGNLQLEDFLASDAPRTVRAPARGDLFAGSDDNGPSKTLVQWKGRMWYDFAVDQVRFEEGVDLKHLSGQELERVFGVSPGAEPARQPGRRTFVTSNVLTVDFLGRSSRARTNEERRMGSLSSDRIRQFRAFGDVLLQDQTEGLWLNADDVVFERDRSLLTIVGSKSRKAQLVKQQPGKLPTQLSMDRLFYNLATGEPEIVGPVVRGQ